MKSVITPKVKHPPKFNRLKRQLREAITSNDMGSVVSIVMKLGEFANSEPSDWKLSPRTFYEFAQVLRQMKNDGLITEGGQAQVLELLRKVD